MPLTGRSMWGCVRRFRALVQALALCGAGAVQADVPPRVVSMNLCTDQYAMLLADPGQILSVTRVSADPLSSPMVDEARAYTLNNGGAEEIFLMQPDVVLASTFTSQVPIAMLRNLGVEVVVVPAVTSLGEIPEAVRLVGEAIGQETRGVAVAETVASRLRQLPEPPSDPPVAAFFYANGYSLGAGTLAHDILSHAGFANLAERRAVIGGVRLSLETLVVEAPDVLISGQPYPGHSRAEDLARHPVLDRWFEADRVFLSGPEWVCGTPFTLDAVEALSAARQALASH